MSSRVTKFMQLVLLLILLFPINCQGPYQEKTHPVIWLDVFDLSFTASEIGPNPAPQTLKVKNDGIQSLTYSISPSVNWLAISPASGTSTGQINEHAVSIDKTGLAAKQEAYTATITVTSSSACNSPQAVSVQFKLSKEPPPEISANPRQLSFIASTGGANPSPQIVKVKNSGQGTLNYSITDDAAWLEVSPASGSSTGGENSHSVSVKTSGLGTGAYTANITISDPNAANNPQVISVTLQIGTALPPMISVTPLDLLFSAQRGGANPPQQRIRIRNAGQQTLNYALTYDAAWMTVSPTSGSSTGQENSHYVSVNIAGLAKGTYTGRITISSPNAANSPQVANVALEIAEVQPPPTNNDISVSCSPSSAQTGATIDVPIAILGNTQLIKAFGIEVTYDATMFDFATANKGSLTGSWGAVDFNLVSPGRLRIGGWGGALSIPVGSSGTLAVVKLRVTCTACSDGQQSQICIGNFTDDIVAMNPAPGCATFTYRK
jgi:hypothetical protein